LVSQAPDLEDQSTIVPAVVIGELHAVAMNSNSPIAGSQPSHNGYLTTRPAILGLAKLLFLGLCQVSYVSAAPLTEYLGIARKEEELPKDEKDPSLWLYLGVAAILVLLGGAFAGLTIALVQLSNLISLMLIDC
jgi:metal transporter CNNM